MLLTTIHNLAQVPEAKDENDDNALAEMNIAPPDVVEYEGQGSTSMQRLNRSLWNEGSGSATATSGPTAPSSSGRSDTDLEEQTLRMTSGKKVRRLLTAMMPLTCLCFAPSCGGILQHLSTFDSCKIQPRSWPIPSQRFLPFAMWCGLCICWCYAGVAGGALRHGEAGAAAGAARVGLLCMCSQERAGGHLAPAAAQ